MSSALTSSQDISYQLIVFVSIFTPLQLIFVGLRFYARSLTTSKYGLDDWLVLASLLGQFVAAGIAIGGVKDAGFGRHIGYLEETNPTAVVNLFKYLVAIPVWYHATVSLSKLAICLLYKRLFPQRYIHITLYVTMGLMIATAVGSIIADFLACRPFSANWAPPEEQALYCVDKEALYVWSSLPNIITDIMLLIIPIPVLWTLQVGSRLKIALGVTFLIGGIGLVASILRFVAFDDHNTFIDATFTAVQLVIWTIAEPGIYLMAACLMMYRPLIEKAKTVAIPTIKQTTASKSASSSRIRSQKHRYGAHSSNDSKSIPLSSKGAGGQFERLSDNPYDRAEQGLETQSQQNIVVTTNIQSTWNAR